MRRLLLFIFALLPLCSYADGWSIETSSRKPYSPATMANGELGVVVGSKPFTIEQIIVGSSYERGCADRVSRILSGINPLGLTMLTDGTDREAKSWSQSIDLRRAVHTTRFSTKDAEVAYSVRALRNMPYAIMIEVEVKALRNTKIEFQNRHSIPGNLTDTLSEKRTVWCEDGGRKVQRSWGSYNNGSSHIAAASVFLCVNRFTQPDADRITAELKGGETASFALIGAVCTTDSFADVWNESERQAIYAVREGADNLVAAHERLWDELWQSDIEIEGDDEAQQAVRFALFNIYSSIRKGSRRSIAPMGLTSQGYNGHIFWDAEMWIYPVLLVLHPELACEMVAYRTDRLAAAQKRAAAYGFQGAMFPWESDDLGEESTPTFALTGALEHHITADVAIAAWNCYRVTQDACWLNREGWHLIRECADFWCSRVSDNGDGTYSIRNVVGADEYAVGVDDNAFTNGSARLALLYAVAAAEVCDEQVNPLWSKIADGLRICTFENGVTREHASYNGEIIKQADVNLLGYPLGISDRESQLRDMEYYIGRIDPENGPAMSHSVFAVQYARAGMTDRAEEMFRRAYMPYLRAPFGVFSETAASDNPYFVTGAGGMLQAVIFGFGGIEIDDYGVTFGDQHLPKNWKRLTIRIANHNNPLSER